MVAIVMRWALILPALATAIGALGLSVSSSPANEPKTIDQPDIDEPDTDEPDSDEPDSDQPDTNQPAGDATTGSDALPAWVEDRQATGMHWRFVTRRGPVHIWLPPGYRHETAGIVLYVHGYYIGVDRAWSQHRLAEQFRRSRRNALFIAPEAPSRRRHKVRWNDLGQLIREVRTRIGIRRPWGPVVAVGHSGAYRTLLAWLSYRPLEHIIMLDALYAHEYPFREWLEQVKGQPNRLTMVAIDTLRWGEPFARAIGYTRALDWIPRSPAEFDAQVGGQIGASATIDNRRFVYMRSQYGHMEIVTEGKTIPVLLEMTRIPAL